MKVDLPLLCYLVGPRWSEAHQFCKERGKRGGEGYREGVREMH